MAKRPVVEGVKNTYNAQFIDKGINVNLSEKAKKLSEFNGKVCRKPQHTNRQYRVVLCIS